jgi:hypothetical protein
LPTPAQARGRNGPFLPTEQMIPPLSIVLPNHKKKTNFIYPIPIHQKNPANDEVQGTLSLLDGDEINDVNLAPLFKESLPKESFKERASNPKIIPTANTVVQEKISVPQANPNVFAEWVLPKTYLTLDIKTILSLARSMKNDSVIVTQEGSIFPNWVEIFGNIAQL